MDSESIKLSQLEVFVAVAECGSFSAAALELQVSQAAASRSLALLEKQLGLALVQRTSAGTSLTASGEQLLPLAQEILEKTKLIHTTAHQINRLQTGTVRIATFRSVATHLLPLAIKQFNQAFPEIKVLVQEAPYTEAIENSLRQGTADIGIMPLPVAEDIQTWNLLQDEYLVLLSEDLQLPSVLSWDDLAPYPLIVPAAKSPCRKALEDYFARVNCPLVPTHEISEDSTAVNMVRHGIGFTIMARLAAQPIPASIQIRKLPVPMSRTIAVGMAETIMHSPPVFACLESIKASLTRPEPSLSKRHIEALSRQN